MGETLISVVVFFSYSSLLLLIDVCLFFNYFILIAIFLFGFHLFLLFDLHCENRMQFDSIVCLQKLFDFLCNWYTSVFIICLCAVNWQGTINSQTLQTSVLCNNLHILIHTTCQLFAHMDFALIVLRCITFIDCHKYCRSVFNGALLYHFISFLFCHVPCINY